MGSTLFKVAAVSSNANSFGLRGMVLMARTGEAWQVGVNHLNVKQVGHLVSGELIGEGGRYEGRQFYGMEYEIPKKLPNAPSNVVEEVWK
jgi:hypothetical protein